MKKINKKDIKRIEKVIGIPFGEEQVKKDLTMDDGSIIDLRDYIFLQEVEAEDHEDEGTFVVKIQLQVDKKSPKKSHLTFEKAFIREHTERIPGSIIKIKRFSKKIIKDEDTFITKSSFDPVPLSIDEVIKLGKIFESIKK